MSSAMMTTGDDTSISSILSRMTSFRFTLNDSENRNTSNASGPPQIPQELHLKIALVGGNGVGKSSIVRRWLRRSYQAGYNQTVGVDVQTMKYIYQGNAEHQIHLHVWDVSSVEVNNPATHQLICDGLDGIFFVFNVHRVSSIAAIDAWRTQLAKYICATEIPFYLLSHKADMLQKRVMTSDDIEAYARTAGYKGWCWTVGRGGLGESEKNPAVMESLDKMVDLICDGKPYPDMLRERYSPSKTMGMLQAVEPGVAPNAEQITPFSSSILHVPTQTITTMPRSGDEDQSSSGFGAEWMFGDQKGQYLVVHARESMDMVESDTEDQVSKIESEQIDDGHDNGWRYFAGSIERGRAESILKKHGEGAFLIRRKDSKTLVLSYRSHDDAHHVLIEYYDGKYHVGAKGPSQLAFTSLSKCLRSVRKYAYRGLTFKRSPRFQVGNQLMRDIVVEEDNGRKQDRMGAWTATEGRSRRESIQMQTTQEQVEVPPKQKVIDMAVDFYSRARNRLSSLMEHAIDPSQITLFQSMIDSELKSTYLEDNENVEEMWRKLVKDMDCWNHILITLEIQA